MSSVVPEGWTKENIGSIFEKISNGTTANQIETENGESVTRIETISDGYINFEKVGKIDIIDAEKRYLMKQGDILFSNINSVKHIGKVAFFNGEKPLFHGMNLLLFRANETLAHSKFIFNLMRSDDFRLEVSKRVKPAINQASISGGDLKEINFLSPPLPEQKKIASILTSVDEVIENTQKQIDKLQDLKKATMNELLTKGIGHTEFKDSELGRIPKSWEVGKLDSYISSITSGWSPDCLPESAKHTEWGILKTTAVKWGGFNVEENKALPPHLEGRPQISLTKGDVLVTRAGPIDRVGVIAFCNENHPKIMLSDKIIRICSKTDELMGEFLSIWLSSHMAQRNMRAKISGMAEAQSNISQDILKSVPIPIPNVSEQKEIAKVLRAIAEGIRGANLKLSQTQSLKKSLMQDLLTGKVRVTVN